MRLENWAVLANFNPYQPPELWRQRLYGLVYGHPNFKDGTDVTTTSIVGVEGDAIRTRSGSMYELGTVDPEYEAQYPNARERLFNSLKESQNG